MARSAENSLTGALAGTIAGGIIWYKANRNAKARLRTNNSLAAT
jgi:hypothetical protein